MIRSSCTGSLLRFPFLPLYIIISEGVIPSCAVYEEASLTLFRFGADSFIEVISGLGIAHMVLRVQRNLNGNRSRFERTPLKDHGIFFLYFGDGPAAAFTGIPALSYFAFSEEKECFAKAKSDKLAVAKD